MNNEEDNVVEEIVEEKKPKKIKVSVIRRMGETILVEWMEGKRRKRGFIPTSKLDDDKVDEKEIAMARPYGIPFADVIQLKATSQQLEDKLYDNGIWTLEDLTANSRILPGILQSVYAVDMAALFRVARDFEN